MATPSRDRGLVGGWIREARLSEQLTQEDLAEKLGVNRTTVADWERGANDPELKHLRAMVALFPRVPPPMSPGAHGGATTHDQIRVLLRAGLDAISSKLGGDEALFLRDEIEKFSPRLTGEPIGPKGAQLIVEQMLEIFRIKKGRK